MDILQTVVEFEIIGNKLWRIFALFGIILIAFLNWENYKTHFAKVSHPI